ncbi:MAG: hypothetical protein AAF361_10625 [Bacteroidota bacterium]
MKKKVTFILPLLAFLATACTSDSESDLTEVEEPDGPISYTANIRGVINSNCLSCHSDPTRNGAPFPLTNFEQVRVRAENGSLLGAISRQTGEAGAMPPSGRLPQATIDLVDQWIQEGLREQ